MGYNIYQSIFYTHGTSQLHQPHFIGSVLVCTGQCSSSLYHSWRQGQWTTHFWGHTHGFLLSVQWPPGPVLVTLQDMHMTPQLIFKLLCRDPGLNFDILKSILNYLWSLSLEFQSPSPCLGTCFHFCSECSFHSAFKKVTSSLKKASRPLPLFDLT